MRGLLALLVALCAACGPPRATPATLPPPPQPLAEVAPRLTAGEQTTWNVFYQGMPIGRTDLVFDGRVARTGFRTPSRAARVLTNTRFELLTAFDGGHVRGMREALTLGGTTERNEAEVDGASYTPPDGEALRVPGGTRLHTLHSALGVVRAWSADRAAQPGYLWVWSSGQLYRLDVARPTRDDVLGLRALRVDGIVRAPHRDGEISISVWLAANADRTPIRFTLRTGPHNLAAEVYESTASLDAR